MDTTSELMMYEYRQANVPCHLCKLQFSSSVERNDHLETHFTRQQCPSCNKLLILIDAELFVLSPHLPSQCLKDIGVRKRTIETQLVSANKRRKSILGEPNILVDGRVRVRNRKSNRVKEKYFAQVDAALEEDENSQHDNENEIEEGNENDDEQGNENENTKAGPKSRRNRPRWAANQEKEATVENTESEDEETVHIKNEVDILEPLEEALGASRQYFQNDEQCVLIPENVSHELELNVIETREQGWQNEPSEEEQSDGNGIIPQENEVVQTLKDLITNNVTEIENVANNMFLVDDISEDEMEAEHVLSVKESGNEELIIEHRIKMEKSHPDTRSKYNKNNPETTSPQSSESNELNGSDASRPKRARTRKSNEKDKDADGKIKKRGRPPKSLSESETGEQSVLKVKPSVQREKVYCDMCNRHMFKHHLTTHIRLVHHGVRKESGKTECDICGYVCSTYGNLNQHRLIHTEPKRFICNHCGRGFNAQFKLNEHENLHTGNKPYECDICGKRFTRRTLKESHMRVHTGEKPFKCKVGDCDRAFAHNTDLKRHQYGAHGIWNKRHNCEVCGKVYPEMKLLRKHLNKHVAAASE